MAVKTCGSSHSALLDHEKSILQQLKDCPQIIECFGGDFSFENGEKLYNLFLEYAMGGSLADKLKNFGHWRLLESEVRRHTESILQGLQCIHENGFVHCDLKLQNVLLCQNDVAKIADFGLTNKSGEKIVGFELRGTPMYMPPETVVAGQQEAAADEPIFSNPRKRTTISTRRWNQATKIAVAPMNQTANIAAKQNVAAAKAKAMIRRVDGRDGD
ncbi:hypothetical protein TEA_008995 [Camellia sinensis var. sinensis]|uniref:Protein kinase domain-containing protein n=1 Tax=Camellia sinensis var. sinensis TaxID=542762 RepID=A0A4S4DG76_CAMSN|nr:hypothetical protein TEA_008995 [Camellia sinensis var. sinensis]